MASSTLELNRQTKHRTKVRIVGEPSAVFDWEHGGALYLVAVTQGHWTIENIQVGTRTGIQWRGIAAIGAGEIDLIDVRLHVGTPSASGLIATRGGQINLSGTIEINEDLHYGGSDQDFARISASYNGSVKFIGSYGTGTLDMGNGSLSASYFGTIELGFGTANITSHTSNNNIAINNSGRVDLHGTPTTLTATHLNNTPVGLEDDGHMLVEGATITINKKPGQHAIILQKSSTMLGGGNVVNIVREASDSGLDIWAMSGSILGTGVSGELRSTYAMTAGEIIIESIDNNANLIGPFSTNKFGRIALPDGRIFP